MFYKRILAVLKVSTNMDTERPYSQNSLSEKKKTGIFIKTASKMPYCKISNVFNRSCHSSKLIMYASAHHPHTTLGVGEQVISLLSEYSRI